MTPRQTTGEQQFGAAILVIGLGLIDGGCYGIAGAWGMVLGLGIMFTILGLMAFFRSMIVGAYVKDAAPDHPAGAEWSMQDAMDWLTRRGHQCRIVAARGSMRAPVNGVRVWSQPTDDELRQHFRQCDVMLTQLDATQHAQLLAVSTGTPLVHLIHSGNQVERLGVLPGCSALVVYNSQSVARANAWWPGESMVLHPPINRQRVVGEIHPQAQLVTLANLSHAKGGMQLLNLAKQLPRVPFMGVMGAYGEQVITTQGIPGHGDNPLPIGLPGNLAVMAPVRDVATQLFPFTRVLLVLSASETYGRIAGEAMLNGIPVLARRTPGLEECCGTAALYVEQDDTIHEVAEQLTDLLEPAEWERWATFAVEQGQYLSERTAVQMTWLEARLEKIVANRPVMRFTSDPHVYA